MLKMILKGTKVRVSYTTSIQSQNRYLKFNTYRHYCWFINKVSYICSRESNSTEDKLLRHRESNHI